MDYIRITGNGLLIRGNGLLNRGNELLIRRNGLLNRGNELLIRRNGLLNRENELLIRMKGLLNREKCSYVTQRNTNDIVKFCRRFQEIVEKCLSTNCLHLKLKWVNRKYIANESEDAPRDENLTRKGDRMGQSMTSIPPFLRRRNV